MKKIHLIVFTVLPVLFFSQSIKGLIIPDSLKNKSYKYIDDAYNKVFQIDNDKAELLANYILLKGKKENNKEVIFEGYYNIARVKNLKNENGHPFADSLITASKNINNYDYPAKSHILKGILFNNEGKYKEALDEYTIAINLNKTENKEQFYYINKLIAILKTATEEYQEALPLFLKYYDYEKNKIKTTNLEAKNYISSIFSLANVYIRCKDYKKSIQFADLGLAECKKYNNYSNYSYLLMIKGISLFYLKDFTTSYTILSEVEKGLINNKDYTNLGVLYYYLGKIKYAVHREDEAIEFFKKADSISFTFNSFEPTKRDGYEILIDFYKKKGDLKNQLKYIDNLIHSDSVIAVNRKNLSKEILKKYDTPILMKEKVSVIEKLNNQNTWLITALLFITLLFIFIIRKNRKKIKEYEKLAKVLSERPLIVPTVQEEIKVESEVIPPTVIEKKEKAPKSDLSSNPKFKILIDKIEQFEKTNSFLNKNITLDSLSKDFDTNRDYLSKLVNELKGKNFSQYLNELRINYIVEELKSNEKIRKHTIAAIADDIGYNNAESFTNAFKKITGTLPSYYIKALH
ncbi:helix-turn-helix domain-containing protein [Chryseobacterium viscerum]|uniref:Helix-turn-helix domain-containing protein n=1 Tax=Chryseobacterium viscerum TaxID=1037377 RepID=A0A5N4BMY5_9FLAO|nr:AraC family transcriptional regulator [Chryseobacterium viscerum]KAB1229766.1 helix-turn-helix domain-containing protein [Chryseobacterium viscerum]